MAGKNTAVFGIYPSLTSVEIGVDELKAGGFRNTDISVLFPESAGTRDFAHEKNTKAPEGATAGAGTGVVIGGALGWLVGIGALAVPTLGPFIAAGPLMAALAGAGVGGTVGGIAGALIGLGIPEYEAKRYEGQVKDRRHPVVRSFRRFRLDEASKRHPQANRSSGHCIYRRSRRR